MSRDSELLAQAETDGMVHARVYGWTEPWVTLGRFQEPAKDLLPECQVPWVCRPTGGRGVLHGHDITIGLAGPIDEDSRSVRTAYRRYAAFLIEALRSCGVEAGLGEALRGFRATGTRLHGDCFAHVAANDVIDLQTGRKVCGCALRLTAKAVLVQASIPIGPPLVDPMLVFPVQGSGGFVEVSPERFADALAGVGTGAKGT